MTPYDELTGWRKAARLALGWGVVFPAVLLVGGFLVYLGEFHIEAVRSLFRAAGLPL